MQRYTSAHSLLLCNYVMQLLEVQHIIRICVYNNYSNNYLSSIAIECPPLLAIITGMISYSPDITPDNGLEIKATYTCEAGFYLEGNEVRVCMDDDGMDAIGVWSGQEPSCVCKLSAMVCNSLVLYGPEELMCIDYV